MVIFRPLHLLLVSHLKSANIVFLVSEKRKICPDKCLSMLILWGMDERMEDGENVKQHPSMLSVQEGSSSVINCSYSDSASSYLPWYKQELGKGPQLLIDIFSSMTTKEDQRLIVSLNKTAKHLSLHIRDTQPEDSAVYFCAASTHSFPGTCCLHSNLGLGQPRVL
uniref:Ig-like domain-containing protein n=1 Tax=Neovison vison TaxID=452646 RepID=A0A8C7BTY1_NEOVI